MDKSIRIDPNENQLDVSLVKVETIEAFIAPVQTISEKREVD